MEGKPVRLWVVQKPNGSLFVRTSTGSSAWRTRNDAIQQASALHGEWKKLRRAGWRCMWIAASL